MTFDMCVYFTANSYLDIVKLNIKSWTATCEVFFHGHISILQLDLDKGIKSYIPG